MLRQCYGLDLNQQIQSFTNIFIHFPCKMKESSYLCSAKSKESYPIA